ncbi:hypothetical protein GUJ93_ZPchr0013g36677 [Zizania palustris]|uniref:Uncharacterized protein n=1 Tax=Zizania palustris TaxID=103762 RepID=A0A8J5X5V1_ZIZPA|nr:hypothetical protein GUJ93_ZPchr0013g36677 [Zizania palustris]
MGREASEEDCMESERKRGRNHRTKVTWSERGGSGAVQRWSTRCAIMPLGPLALGSCCYRGAAFYGRRMEEEVQLQRCPDSQAPPTVGSTTVADSQAPPVAGSAAVVVWLDLLSNGGSPSPQAIAARGAPKRARDRARRRPAARRRDDDRW